MLVHGVGDFFVRGGGAFFDGEAEVLVDGAQQFIELLASFEEAGAKRVGDDVGAEGVEFGDFFLRGGHAGHVLVAQFFAVFVYFAEEVGGVGVLVEEADAGFGGDDFLALRDGGGQLGGELDKLGRERSV